LFKRLAHKSRTNLCPSVLRVRIDPDQLRLQTKVIDAPPREQRRIPYANFVITTGPIAGEQTIQRDCIESWQTAVDPKRSGGAGRVLVARNPREILPMLQKAGEQRRVVRTASANDLA
jgi:hypothetical protein